MKYICNSLLLFLFAASFSYAQNSNQTQTASAEDIRSYLSQVTHYGIIYNGKAEERYRLSFTNHPYFYTDKFSVGTLCYNDIVYLDVMLRYDIHRESIVVRHSEILNGVELNKEAVNWAVFNGYKIIASKEVDWENIPDNRFLILLYEDIYPIIKTSKASLRSRINNSEMEYYFELKDQYYICVNKICYPLKNRKSILDLFPDKRKELKQYAKQIDLDFKRDPELAYVELIKYYERLSR